MVTVVKRLNNITKLCNNNKSWASATHILQRKRILLSLCYMHCW